MRTIPAETVNGTPPFIVIFFQVQTIDTTKFNTTLVDPNTVKVLTRCQSYKLFPGVSYDFS
jgi:hypothetical protein